MMVGARWVLVVAVMVGVGSIQVRMTKRNLFIPEDSNFESSL